MRAAPPKAIREPKLPAELETRLLADLESGTVVEACRLEACTLSGTKAPSVRFDGVHIAGGALDESKLANLTWLDVVCERCNLSLLDWRGAKLTRVVVRGCRLTGAKLVECELDSVRFIDCHIDYASFSNTRFRQVVFESCQLREAHFHGADLTGTSFVGCELQGADFGRTKLQGVDVSSSNLGQITVGPADVRGLVVNRSQASELAKLLGLVVRD